MVLQFLYMKATKFIPLINPFMGVLPYLAMTNLFPRAFLLKFERGGGTSTEKSWKQALDCDPSLVRCWYFIGLKPSFVFFSLGRVMFSDSRT